MAISSKQLKILDITNYLTTGTSLSKFYALYNVSTPKGYFLYSWFDSMTKLGEMSDIGEFYSILTKQSISPNEYQLCKNVWTSEGMETFADFICYYNNADVIGFVEAVEKMIANEGSYELDIFKESISLPGLTQKVFV